MKSPHTQRPDDEARELTEEFIRAHARKPAGQRAAELKTEAVDRAGPAQIRAVQVSIGGSEAASKLRPVARERLSIAQVSPHPWGAPHEVNEFVVRGLGRPRRAGTQGGGGGPRRLEGGGPRVAPCDPGRP